MVSVTNGPTKFFFVRFLIGVELQKSSPNGNDGKGYFKVKNGRGSGCFARFSEIDSIDLRWNIERIIWIGYYKQYHNKNCIIALLSKDVVGHILCFLHVK